MPTSIKAEPFISEIKFTTTRGMVVDPNNLKADTNYLLKLTYGNNSPNKIPKHTCRILIGLGLGLDIDQTTLKKVPYLTYAYRKEEGQQAQINCSIEGSSLPANYSKTLTFHVKTKSAQESTASVNFLISNNNPDYILSDINPTNNGGTVGYIIN